ncbi:MAG: CocE/NonD family hydrolase, partial [Gemmatimonadales bacterium]
MRLVALAALTMFPLSCASAQRKVEEIAFESGPFRIVGDLRTPEGPGPHPVVLFVHGDGPNNRTSGVTYPPLMDRMLRAGYATFAWDKPGTGASTGEIDRSRLMDQRVQIVLDAIDVVQARPDIDTDRIGMWGISQAGYVMPRVLERSDDVAFMIAVSCPGEPGVEQGAYLVTAQVR